MHLAQLRAQDARDADRPNALSGILQLVDQAEKEEVERLATAWADYRMTNIDARLFQTLSGAKLFRCTARTKCTGLWLSKWMSCCRKTRRF